MGYSERIKGKFSRELNNMAKKVLITGVNGFLGSSLSKYVKAKQPSVKVFGVDLLRAKLSSRTVTCDLADQKKVSKLISRIRPDHIFHLVGGRIDNEPDFLKANIMTTRSLLEAVSGIRGYRPRIILPGSAAEYGKTVPSGKPVRETAAARPESFYGFVKNAQTNLGLMYARAGLDVVIARIFNVCGFGMPPKLSLGRFSQQIAMVKKSKKKAVLRTGYLGMRRDYLDVEDVSAALMAIARRGKKGEIYNICSGRAYLMRDLLGKLIDYADVRGILVKEDKKAASSIHISVGSNAKLKKATGWTSNVDISQSLENTLNYYREFVLKGKH